MNLSEMSPALSYDQQAPDNSLLDYNQRGAGFMFHVHDANITGTGAVNLNVFKYTGAIRVFRQWAQITSITTLTNMTDVYAQIWDGTVATDLTKTPGAVLSGVPVGTYFTKNRDASQTYTVLSADQARFTEDDSGRPRPFTCNAKNGVDSYIRFNFTTTDSPIDFLMDIWFEWYPLTHDATLVVA